VPAHRRARPAAACVVLARPAAACVVLARPAAACVVLARPAGRPPPRPGVIAWLSFFRPLCPV